MLYPMNRVDRLWSDNVSYRFAFHPFAIYCGTCSLINQGDFKLISVNFVEKDDLESTVDINSRQKTALLLRAGSSDKQDISVFDKLLRKHRISDNDASIFVQFKPNETGLDWSGPVCVAALGRFFLKFRRSSEPPVQQSDLNRGEHGTTWEFASVHVVKEASTFVLHFHNPPDTGLPYRIENHLHDASITYYQKVFSHLQKLEYHS